MTEERKWIPESECEDGRVYRIHSRNLFTGVYRAATRGFVGIREKFGSEYLFEEYASETGPPHGTVKVISAYDLTIEVPEDYHREYGPEYQAVMELLRPLDEAIHEERRLEDERYRLEALSKAYTPQTKAEYEKAQRHNEIRDRWHAASLAAETPEEKKALWNQYVQDMRDNFTNQTRGDI